MERVLHDNEETALNPDPFDPVEPEFVAGAVVGPGTMRQGSDAGGRTGNRGYGGSQEGLTSVKRAPAPASLRPA
jgi:hypothetical protein